MAFVPLYRINTFTGQHYDTELRTGNPAGVVLLSEESCTWVTDSSCQALANELNLPGTAFVSRTNTEGTFELRWFTPEKEVKLCGHTTLAAAHAVLDAGWASSDEDITFSTQHSGDVIISTTNWETKCFEMTCPLLTHREKLKSYERDTLLSALNVDDKDVEDAFRSDYDVMVVLRSWRHVSRVCPDMEDLKRFRTRGVIVAGVRENGERTRIVSRFFAPRSGIEEDVVTVSAHCALAAEFLGAGGVGFGRQVSSRRGEVEMRRTGDGLVVLGGVSCLVFRGEVKMIP